MNTRSRVVCLYKQEGAGYYESRKVDGAEVQEFRRGFTELRIGAVNQPTPKKDSDSHAMWKGTPQLSLQMWINTDGADLFEVNKEFYLDFIMIDEPPAGRVSQCP